MVIKTSENNLGLVTFSISSIEDLNDIDTSKILPASSATLIDENGVRVFMLNGDRTKWVEV